MTIPQISLLHASYGRPQKAVAAMQAAFRAAQAPADVEYVVATEVEDKETINAFAKEVACGGVDLIVSGPFNGSAPAWDAAASHSHGDLLVQMQDDVELPMGWDRLLREKYQLHLNWYHSLLKPSDDNAPLYPSVVIHVSDGHRKDGLMCTAIMNRVRYEQVGEFLHAGYQSVFSDGDLTYRALLDERNGKCQVIDARDITFLHRHHYHYPKDVPMDATYARENSAEAYSKGMALFDRRNPGWRGSGLVDWI